MQRRPFFFNQPEPGRKASKADFEKYKMHAAALSVGAGLAGAAVSYALRIRQINKEIRKREEALGRMEKLQKIHSAPQSQSEYASNGNMDAFLTTTRAGMMADLREEAKLSDVMIADMESEIAGYYFARDGACLMIAFASAMLIGFAGWRILARKEERKPAAPAPQEGGQRERRAAVEMEGPAHAPTQIPAPAPPPPVVAMEEKFPRPPYFNELFNDLKRSIREEMRSPGSAEAAEAFLCVMSRNEVEDLIHWPETIELHIAKNRDRLKEFLKEKKIDPRHLFERLGPEVTDLF
ncbi:hypothetical protein H0O01_05380 [Candidatus Micrarchaeota archaeon]|nr:hypothetical protein [Candidatus Micrarchaeota archaeon]